MIISQENKYYFLELMSTKQIKMRLLTIDEPHYTFGINSHSLLCYYNNSCSEITLDANPANISSKN
jgi:hypothetical protein